MGVLSEINRLVKQARTIYKAGSFSEKDWLKGKTSFDKPRDLFEYDINRRETESLSGWHWLMDHPDMLKVMVERYKDLNDYDTAPDTPPKYELGALAVTSPEYAKAMLESRIEANRSEKRLMLRNVGARLYREGKTREQILDYVKNLYKKRSHHIIDEIAEEYEKSAQLIMPPVYKAEAVAAYRNGEIGPNDPIEIKED